MSLQYFKVYIVIPGIRQKMEGSPQINMPMPVPTVPVDKADRAKYSIITYTNPKHIRYLQDFLSKQQSTSSSFYKKLDLQQFDQNSITVNEYDSIHEKLYKKYARDGYLQKTKDITKKAKKAKDGSDQNYYNGMDPFINDAEVDQGQRDKKQVTYSDFKVITGNTNGTDLLTQFYKSVQYRPEIITQAKRKIDRTQITEVEREIIRKVKNKRDEQSKKQTI